MFDYEIDFRKIVDILLEIKKITHSNISGCKSFISPVKTYGGLLIITSNMSSVEKSLTAQFSICILSVNDKMCAFSAHNRHASGEISIVTADNYINMHLSI